MPRNHNLWWQSSYDRGLDILLFMWSDIKARYPDAELHIAYGWDLFDKVSSNNPERMQWKASVEQMMSQDGVFHYGRIGQDKLKELRKECGIWAYPTYFPEINCIGALEAQSDGLVPVTMNDFAFKETVGSGIKIDGDIYLKQTRDTFLKELLDLMGDKKRWEEESKKATKFAKEFEWGNIASKWVDEFKTPVTNPLVSIVTVTKRAGWWNVMADRISKQTYRNFEWVIVDDYKEDRSEIAKEYAEKYGIDIKYVRGDKALGTYKKKYGLSRANNTAYKASKGELLVWVQDFILIPKNGVEALVDLYRHNPNALLAPVDESWFPKHVNEENTEDWFDGWTDIVGEFSWRNVRVLFQGIREADSPFDFELNYAGIPRHIVERLNGWYEFFDVGIGYDNTEFAKRAMDLGYKILIDDTNLAIGLEISDKRTETNDDMWEKFKSGDYPAVREDNA